MALDRPDSIQPSDAQVSVHNDSRSLGVDLRDVHSFQMDRQQNQGGTDNGFNPMQGGQYDFGTSDSLNKLYGDGANSNIAGRYVADQSEHKTLVYRPDTNGGGEGQHEVVGKYVHQRDSGSAEHKTLVFRPDTNENGGGHEHDIAGSYKHQSDEVARTENDLTREHSAGGDKTDAPQNPGDRPHEDGDDDLQGRYAGLLEKFGEIMKEFQETMKEYLDLLEEMMRGRGGGAGGSGAGGGAGGGGAGGGAGDGGGGAGGAGDGGAGGGGAGGGGAGGGGAGGGGAGGGGAGGGGDGGGGDGGGGAGGGGAGDGGAGGGGTGGPGAGDGGHGGCGGHGGGDGGHGGGDGGAGGGGDGGGDGTDGGVVKTKDGHGDGIPLATKEQVDKAMSRAINNGVSQEFVKDVRNALAKQPKAFLDSFLRDPNSRIVLDPSGGGVGGTFSTDGTITLYEDSKSYITPDQLVSAEFVHFWDLGTPGSPGANFSERSDLVNAYNKARNSGMGTGDNSLSDPVEFMMALARHVDGNSNSRIDNLFAAINAADVEKAFADALKKA